MEWISSGSLQHDVCIVQRRGENIKVLCFDYFFFLLNFPRPDIVLPNLLERIIKPLYFLIQGWYVRVSVRMTSLLQGKELNCIRSG